MTAALMAVGCSDKPIALRVGQPAPLLAMAEVKGGKIDMASMTAGKTVVVLFWNVGCAYCEREMPHLEDIYKSNIQNGLLVLAVNAGDPKPAVEEYVKKANMTFPVLMDEKGKAARAYGVKGVPMMFIMGRDGRIVEKVLGAATGKMLDEMIEQHLGK